MRQAAFRLFRPILAGATLRGRIVGCIGVLLAIPAVGFLSSWLVGGAPMVPLIVATMGASAVLLFAVPSSPLAQPWPAIGGTVIAALAGVTVAKLVPDLLVASGLAVALAILAMSLTRSLHPPGGAAALAAVIGGPAVTSTGYMYVIVPVALNSVLMVLAAIAFHRLARTSYPHRPIVPPVNQHGTTDIPPLSRVGFSEADIDAALASVDETFDIGRDDLGFLLQRIELESLNRSIGSPKCADIMSRDVVTIGIDATREEAMEVLLAHEIRTLPVIDEAGALAGMLGLRQLIGASQSLRELIVEAKTVGLDDDAIAVLPALTDGRSHAVIVIGTSGDIRGVISQTDLLAVLFRSAAKPPGARP